MKNISLFFFMVGYLGLVQCDGTGPGPLSQPGLPTACSEWYTAKMADTCHDIAGNHSLDLKAFIALNPQLNDDCHNSLWASYAYCVAGVPKTTTALPTSHAAIAITTTLPQAQPAPTKTSTPPSSNQKYEGDLTYYAVGLGACGVDDSGKDKSANIVALPHGVMGEKSNGNPNCGKSITIQYQDKTTTAVVHDKCMGCQGDSIDASEKVWSDLGVPLTAGRVRVQWSFN